MKALWRDAGCPEKRLHSAILRSVMRGIRRALLAPQDKCAAFVLPNLTLSGYYFNPPSSRWLLFKAATALGFHAMLRYGAFCQFSSNALTLVLKSGRELAYSSCRGNNRDLGPNVVLGVLFTFVPKFTLSNGLGTTFSHTLVMLHRGGHLTAQCVCSQAYKQKASYAHRRHIPYSTHQSSRPRR